MGVGACPAATQPKFRSSHFRLSRQPLIALGRHVFLGEGRFGGGRWEKGRPRKEDQEFFGRRSFGNTPHYGTLRDRRMDEREEISETVFGFSEEPQRAERDINAKWGADRDPSDTEKACLQILRFPRKASRGRYCAAQSFRIFISFDPSVRLSVRLAVRARNTNRARRNASGT